MCTIGWNDTLEMVPKHVARAPKQSLPSKKCWPLHHGHEMPTRNHARAGGLPGVLTHPKLETCRCNSL
jgi:hypothetical protein